MANIFQNPFNDPVAKTNTMLSAGLDGLLGNHDVAKSIINDGNVGVTARKERMKGADNDVIESLAKMQIGGFCDFNTKMGEFMERLMRINLNEHNITLEETGMDSHNYGDSDSLNYNITKSYSYTKGNNYIEDFVKQVKKSEPNGIDATQNMSADGAYMKTTNMYPDDITGAGTGDFRSYEKWAVKNKNSILYKTKQLFKQKKINTVISRFGTNADGRSNDILYKGSNRTAYGESHGRNLLTKDAENGGGGYNINGYNNPYCRVWTHHYKYDKLNKTIRPLSGEGNISTFHTWPNGFENKGALQGHYVGKGKPILNIYKSEGTGAFGSNDIISEVTTVGYDKPVNGNWKGDENIGWKYSVLDTSKGGDGLLRITPKFSKGNTESNIHTKDCMFSIENLAWKGYDPYSFENALSWEQRGPLGGRIMWFPPYGIEFNESTNVNWSRNSFIGRGEDVYTYVNTQRTGNLSFLMVVDHPSIIDYATWNTNAPQPSETDMLRFFAGCDDGEGSDSLTSYVQPTPLTDEGVNIVGDREKKKKKEEEAPKGDKTKKGEDTEKTNITVKVMAFFPNNYSGSYDEWAYTFGYLLMGKNTWTNCEVIYNNGKYVYIDKDWFKEENVRSWRWKGTTRIDLRRDLPVDFKEVLLNGKFELFENAGQIKDESGNWVTEVWEDGEYKGKPYFYLANGKDKRGYECNTDNGISTSKNTGICKSDNNNDMPCDYVIYGYRTTFQKAYDQFVKDNKRHKGVVWHYRVDGEYRETTDVENTFGQRIPDPNGGNTQPNENYRDTTNFNLNLLASSWAETFGGGSTSTYSGSGNTTLTGTTVSYSGNGTPGNSNGTSPGGTSGGNNYNEYDGSGYVNEKDRDAAFWGNYEEDDSIDFTTVRGIRAFLEDPDKKLQPGKRYKFLGDSGNSTDIEEINLKNRVCEDFNDLRRFDNTSEYGNNGGIQVNPTIRSEETLNKLKQNIVNAGFKAVGNNTANGDDDNKWKKYCSDNFNEKSCNWLKCDNIIEYIKTEFYGSAAKCEVEKQPKHNADEEQIYAYYQVDFIVYEKPDSSGDVESYRIYVNWNDTVNKVLKRISHLEDFTPGNSIIYYPYEFETISVYVKMIDPVNIEKNKCIYLKAQNNAVHYNSIHLTGENDEGGETTEPKVLSSIVEEGDKVENGNAKPVTESVNKSENSAKEEEEIILCSLNDFVAAMDKGLFKTQEATNSVQPGKNVTVTLPNGTKVDSEISSALTTTTKMQTQLNNNNYLYNRSRTKNDVKKLWELFNEGELVSVECKGYSNSHGTATAGSKANNSKLAVTRATRLGELIEARFGVKAEISSESAKAVTGQDHNSKEAKLWRSAVATLKFQVAKKDDVHNSQTVKVENTEPLGDYIPATTVEDLYEGQKDDYTPVTTTEDVIIQTNHSNNISPKSTIKGNRGNIKCENTEWRVTTVREFISGIGKHASASYITNMALTLTTESQGISYLSGLHTVQKNILKYDKCEFKYKLYNNGSGYYKWDCWLTEKYRRYLAFQNSDYNCNKPTLIGDGYTGKSTWAWGLYADKGTFYSPSQTKTLLYYNIPKCKVSLSNTKAKTKEVDKNRGGMTKNGTSFVYDCDSSGSRPKSTKKETKKVESKTTKKTNGGGSGNSNSSTERPNTQTPDATPVNNTPTVDTNKELEEIRRKTREAEWAADLLRRKAAEESYKQEGNKIVEETVLKRITPDYLLRSDRKGNGDKNVLRYDQEYYFFKSLEKKDKIVYDKLMDKIKYFDPAFHSMTPEGFNARLTFLNQCTRQGNTISASDQNNTEEGKSNKSVKTANNLAFGRPPYCVLRLGDFYNQMIVINSINIDYSVSDGIQWDMNTEGIGMQPLLARVNISFNFIGGSDMAGPVRRLQNAMTFNYYANARYYDNRADRMSYPANTNSLPMGALEYNVDKENSTAYVTAMRK